MWRMLADWLLPLKAKRIAIGPQVLEAAAEPIASMCKHLDAVLSIDDLGSFEETHVLPRRFLHEMDAALGCYDRFVATVVEGAGLAATCGKGCVACCHDAPTGVSSPEVLLAYHAYRALPDALDLHNYACTLSDALFAEVGRYARGKKQLMTGSRAFQRGQLAYRRRRLPCVFLDPRSGLCRIYGQRPISCRMHLSLSDPSWCWAESPEARKAESPNIAPPPFVRSTLDEIGGVLGLGDVSPVLFRGIAELGGRVFRDRPLRVSGQPVRPRPARGGGRRHDAHRKGGKQRKVA